MKFIRGIRSGTGGGRLISRFQAGGPLRKPSQANEHVTARINETNELRTRKTSEIFGRKRGSWSQQHCVNIHNLSVKVELVGRDGRLPSIIANMATEGRLSLNGFAPVNTCSNTKYQ